MSHGSYRLQHDELDGASKKKQRSSSEQRRWKLVMEGGDLE